ncbi:HNH endonuclease signature motif containing protein [Aureimonas pseudogalii]|uniref:AP2/ERF domain-containing protein n=1 Tax=Aureimonas pseudogalii TaxID=1744844 RepID=A0A7W6EFH4_9HYPH|nr:HNH endonuclease signature motif containing protein [Aureimonas pseudogalii]MBB3997258.1 hypothetical protein [Aureimonas pseudogalii]
MSKELPDQALLLSLLSYEADTGRLTRKALPLEHFMGSGHPGGPSLAALIYNARNAGREAFTTSDARGYKHGKVQGVNYQAHRVIWKMVHGEDPNIIDHIDGDPSNNRIGNLRSCTNEQNCRNYKKPAGSSSYRGVCWVRRDKRWAARISVGKLGKMSLGNFRSEIEAARAYDAAAVIHHGEFAILNFPEEARIRSSIEPSPVEGDRR